MEPDGAIGQEAHDIPECAHTWRGPITRQVGFERGPVGLFPVNAA